jgi:hypothetical protein
MSLSGKEELKQLPVDPELLALLRCPSCKHSLQAAE